MSVFWYILCPGELEGEADKKPVYFDAHDLARYYKVPMSRCLVQREDQGVVAEFNQLPRLRPDPSGKWVRPKNPRYKGKKKSA